jgi:predicted MPP superfamily phosphohydrolase
VLLGGAAAALAGLGLYAGWIEPRSLRMRRFACPMPGLSAPVRAVAIGDLQAWLHHWPASRLRAAFARAQAERPDVVFWLGDYFDAPTKGFRAMLARAPALRRAYDRLKTPMDAIAAEMGRLTAPMGAYAVLGNHDWIWSGATVAQSLRREGVHVLIGEAAEALHPETGARLTVLGLDDASSDRPTGWTTLAAKAGGPSVALTHAPDVWAQMTPRPALTLAGHTHGGQVAPFGYRRLRLPSHGRLYPYGWYAEGAARLYVTSGIGASPPPLRLQSPPEIVVIDLTPAPLPDTAPAA